MFNRNHTLRAAALAAVLLVPGPALAETWEIDPVHSSVSFSVRHMMVSRVKGRFHNFAGTIQFDGKDTAKASVQATIQTSSVDTGEPKRDTHLQSADFFDVQKFPLMTFQSTKVEPAGEQKARITGNLTLHGVTQPVTLEAEFAGIAKTPWGYRAAGFSAKGSVDRKAFGIKWNKALDAGGVVVGDEVAIELEVEAKEASPTK